MKTHESKAYLAGQTASEPLPPRRPQPGLSLPIAPTDLGGPHPLAGSVTLLVDSSKFGKPAPFTVAGFGSIDCMVCDEAPDGQLAALMARKRVEIIC